MSMLTRFKRNHPRMYLLYFYLLLTITVPSNAMGETYTLVYQGSLYAYSEPQWLPSSKGFVIGALEENLGNNDQLSKLFLYSLDGDGNFKGARIFSDIKPMNHGPVKANPRTKEFEERLAVSLKFVNGVDDILCYRANWDKSNVPNERFYPFTLSVPEIPNFDSFKGAGDNYAGYSGLALAYQSPRGNRGMLTFRNLPGRNVLVEASGEYYDFLNVYQFDEPIQSLAMSSDESKIFIITGQETQYHFWQANDAKANFEEVKIQNIDFTIFNEIQVCPSDPNYISFLGSDHTLRGQEQGIICIVELATGEIIKRIDAFRHKQIISYLRNYHQWDNSGRYVYFLQSDIDENIELYKWDFKVNKSIRSNLPETNMKGFSISPDGRYLLITSNDPAQNMRVYVID